MILSLLFNILFLALGTAGLYYGAELLVKGGSALARKMGVPPLVIGLTLVAFATSAPELVVSLRSAIQGNADVSLGNVVGSNICNIALILGLSALITPLAVEKALLKRDVPIMILSAIVLACFYFFSRGLNRLQGLIFFTAFIIYTLYCIFHSMKEEKEKVISMQDGAELQDKEADQKTPSAVLSLVLVAAGLGLLVAGAEFFLKGALYFAKLLKLSDAVIGLTLVAVGTSLPELATSIVAACRKEADIAVGNVVGSNIFNILGILGITPLITPMTGARLQMADLGVMVFCSLLLLPFMRTHWTISRKEGAFLLLLYCAYTAYLILFPA